MADDIAVETKTYEQPNPAGAKPAPQATASEVPEAAEQTSAAQTTETAAAPEADASAVETSDADAAKAKRTPKWAQERFNALTRQKGELERENTALKTELEAARKTPAQAANVAQPEGGAAGAVSAQPAKPAAQPNIEELVNVRAQQIVAQQTYQKNLNDMARRGAEEFSDFQDRCNFLADLGAGDNPNFLPAVSALEDGHKVLAELADKPEEAQRILSLTPIQMAAELGRMSAKVSGAPQTAVKPEKKISTAPAPIKPIDATAKPNDAPSPDDSDAEWFAKRARQREERRQARSARF